MGMRYGKRGRNPASGELCRGDRQGRASVLDCARPRALFHAPTTKKAAGDCRSPRRSAGSRVRGRCASFWPAPGGSSNRSIGCRQSWFWSRHRIQQVLTRAVLREQRGPGAAPDRSRVFSRQLPRHEPWCQGRTTTIRWFARMGNRHGTVLHGDARTSGCLPGSGLHHRSAPVNAGSEPPVPRCVSSTPERIGTGNQSRRSPNRGHDDGLPS